MPGKVRFRLGSNDSAHAMARRGRGARWMSLMASALLGGTTLVTAGVVALTGAPAGAAVPTVTYFNPQPGGTQSVCGALCVLGNGTSASVAGNGTVNVGSPGMLVDSASQPALTAAGNAQVNAGNNTAPVGVVGTAQTSGNATVHNLIYVSHPAPDPFAGVTVPVPSGQFSVQTASVSGNQSLTIPAAASSTPAVFNTIAASGNASLTLKPGVYLVTGSFSVSGHATVHGTGVVIYLACASYPAPCANGGQPGASLTLAGNGQFNITPPSGSCLGFSVVMDPHNTSSVSVSGNGVTIGGVVYAASGSLSISGNGSLT